MITDFKGVYPRISRNTFVADSAVVIGDVELGEFSSVWFNAVIRGDMEEIKIGSRTNIQDNVVLHTDPGAGVEIGDRVTVGHGAVVHGCLIESNVIIGMNSTVLNGAQIGKNSIVGANALVPPNKKFPEGSIIMGVPGAVKKEADSSDIQMIENSAEEYVKLTEDYQKP